MKVCLVASVNPNIQLVVLFQRIAMGEIRIITKIAQIQRLKLFCLCVYCKLQDWGEELGTLQDYNESIP